MGNVARFGVFALMGLAIALSRLVEVELRQEPVQLQVAAPAAPREVSQPQRPAPAPQPRPSRPTPAPPQEPARTYVVRSGDTLGSISKRAYGTTRHWKAILEANKDVIPSAKAMRAGVELKLPNLRGEARASRRP